MLLAFLLTAILAVSQISLCTSTDPINVKSIIQTPMPLNNSTMPPILDATASKLIRYRSKPPPNFFRHKSQPPKRSRPRVIKSPKIKPNRPVYTQQHFEQNLQPSNFYKFKPEIHTSTLAYKPSYTSYEEIHYEVRPESYPKKESINYETQSMDLDFYGETYPKKKIVTQYEYSKPQKTYSKPQKIVQQFEFSKPQKTYSIQQQQPQKTYESPKEQQSFDYSYPSKPEVHYEISYHEESPEPEYHHPAPPPSPPKQKYEEFSSYGPPPKKFHQTEQVSYQIPDNKYEPPASSYHPPELPSKEGPYQIYDKKLPNNGYKYNNDFAEPPTDIHIIHSPSYDIEPLPKQSYDKPHETYGPPPSDIYGSPHSVYGPPEYNNKQPVESYHPPNSGQFAEPPGSYLPPPHLPDDLPLNKNHMPPGYDYPKSSYEVPLYDPIPFESTTAEQDFFPPNHYDGPVQHEHVSESNTHIQHIPSSPSIPPTTSTKQNDDHQVQQANTKVNRFSPTNKRRFKKPNRYQTTAKVPTSSEENFLPEAPSSEFIDEVISTTSSRPRRKRKRTKAPPVAEKHNLDAPELEEAFETGRDHRISDEELTAASDIKENIKSPQEPQSKIKKITEFSSTNSWNPMRIRTKQTNPQRGQRLASPPTSLNDLKNVEVISIQKSHSHSYYAGTEAPTTKRTRTMTSRADAIKMPTVSTTTTSRSENLMKPTRGGLVIDTTYFKVKGHDEDQEYYDGTGKLPKNHKMF